MIPILKIVYWMGHAVLPGVCLVNYIRHSISLKLMNKSYDPTNQDFMNFYSHHNHLKNSNLKAFYALLSLVLINLLFQLIAFN